MARKQRNKRMKQIKRAKWVALLALVLAAALVPGAALAAAGDADLGTSQELVSAYNDALVGACEMGGKLYLCGMSNIYTYDPAGGELTPAAFAPEFDEGETAYPAGIVSDGEQLYVLEPVYYTDEDEYGADRLDLVPVELDGGEAEIGEPLEIDVDDLINEVSPDFSMFVDLPGCCWVGDTPVLLTDDQARRQVYVVDPEEEYGWYVEGIEESVCCIAPYGEDRLLIACSDAGSAVLYLYDPAEDELEQACAPVKLDSGAENLFAGLAYSAEGDHLFYLDGGSVMMAEGFDLANAKSVASVSLAQYVQSTGMVLPGELYAYNTADAGTFVRATQGRAEITAQLVVQGTDAFEASAQVYSAFTAAHEDVALVMNGGAPDSDQLIQAMMNRDSSVDVYLLPAESEAYDALYGRDFLAPLDDAAIAWVVEGMYPAVRDAVTRNGEIVALPVVARGTTIGLDYAGFEKIGISRDEVPGNWPELLALLPEVQEMLPEDENMMVFDGITTQPELREKLLREILRSWRNAQVAEGKEVSYNDPALAEAIAALMDLDLDALDVPRDEAEADAMLEDVEAAASGDRPYRLLELETGCVFGNFYSLNDPAPLAVVPGVQGWLPVDVTVAVINPYSKNPELAQEFLVELLHNTSTTTAYSLSDAQNDPVPNPRTEQVKQEIQAEIDRLEAELENADSLDAPAIEDSIAEQQRMLDTMDEFGMMISQKNIDWYRPAAQRMVVERFDDLSADSELDDLVQQLLSGRMQPESFVKEIDEKVRMRQREGY